MSELNRLQILFNDASAVTFTDRTKESFEFGRDTFVLALEATPSVDYLYIGRTKPFNALYFEVSVVNAVSTTLTLEYYNGTAWTALTVPVEDTKAFQRSGFIKWDLPINDGRESLWEEVAVNSTTRYWIRIQTAANLTATTALQGINLIFSDDEDLKSEDYGILNYLPKDEAGDAATSHIRSHVSAKRTIIDRLRRSGKYVTEAEGAKQDADEGLVRVLDEWDLLEIEQLRQASKYFTLEKIYREASDSIEDVHWAKAEKYLKQATDAMDIFLLTIDANDDGNIDSGEKLSTMSSGRFTRA